MQVKSDRFLLLWRGEGGLYIFLHPITSLANVMKRPVQA
jgi:hypothetical protein